jgi:hypothetical protein
MLSERNSRAEQYMDEDENPWGLENLLPEESVSLTSVYKVHFDKSQENFWLKKRMLVFQQIHFSIGLVYQQYRAFSSIN